MRRRRIHPTRRLVSSSHAPRADINPPETPLEKIYDDKSGKRRVTGPIGFAIDGKDETAWGIDAGPGRRNQPRKAVFKLEKPISFPSGAVLKLEVAEDHGGWNSDDNQNHNLGRFRLSITSALDVDSRPAPSERPGRVGDRSGEAEPRPDRRGLQLLADDRSRMEGGQRPDR